MKKKHKNSTESKHDEKELPGDPVYSPDEDIYNREKKEVIENGEESTLDEGLDVPGSELDDADELIGEEDEENNYYSLGGDDHDDLEQDNG